MKDEFEKNFEQLKVELVELDSKFKEMASNVPSKTFFVSHAAFGYIADSYGLEQVAIAGLNSQSEPSQKQLATIVKEAKEQNVHYVLFEQNVSSKLTDVVRKEIGAESLMLHNLGVLTVDDVKNNEDYFSLMEQNIETLKKALSGKVNEERLSRIPGLIWYSETAFFMFEWIAHDSFGSRPYSLTICLYSSDFSLTPSPPTILSICDAITYLIHYAVVYRRSEMISALCNVLIAPRKTTIKSSVGHIS